MLEYVKKKTICLIETKQFPKRRLLGFFCIGVSFNGKETALIENNKKGIIIMICEYGCGQEAKFLMSSGKWCCSVHFNKCPAIRKRNSEAN